VRVLGLDLSKTSTGYAVWGPGDARPHSGTWELGSAFTSRGLVFAKLHQNMSDLNRLGKIDAIFFEETIHPAKLQGHTNIDTLRVLSGLAAHAESWGEAMKCRAIYAVNQSTWRRLFLGKLPPHMRSSDLKDMAMRRARQLGFHPTKHDQAEAIGILDFGCEQLGLSPPWRVQGGLLSPLAVAG
jgi:hypothetical protein